jgi:2-methylisocitrate lyase-like PEP mutase family enzyme
MTMSEPNASTGATPAAQLRSLLAERKTLIAPGVFDGMSAALVRERGFACAYMSGAAVAASAVGHPDVGLATLTEMAAQAVVIRRQLDVPIIADADTGFGDVTNVVRTVAEYERAGVAAIQLEDQVFPKRCGHLDEKEIVPGSEFVEKIRAAVEARRQGTLIVARTDALATEGWDRAIERANAYARAGADLVFVEAMLSVDQIAEAPKVVEAPLVFNVVPQGKTPAVPYADLRAWGYAVAIVPAACFAPATAAMRHALAKLAAEDLDTSGQDSPGELFTALGLEYWQRLQATYTGEPAHA